MLNVGVAFDICVTSIVLVLQKMKVHGKFSQQLYVLPYNRLLQVLIPNELNFIPLLKQPMFLN